MGTRHPRIARRIVLAILLASGLAGCVYAPPYAYDSGYSGYAYPAYAYPTYVGPPVTLDLVSVSTAITMATTATTDIAVITAAMAVTAGAMAAAVAEQHPLAFSHLANATTSSSLRRGMAFAFPGS